METFDTIGSFLWNQDVPLIFQVIVGLIGGALGNYFIERKNRYKNNERMLNISEAIFFEEHYHKASQLLESPANLFLGESEEQISNRNYIIRMANWFDTNVAGEVLAKNIRYEKIDEFVRQGLGNFYKRISPYKKKIHPMSQTEKLFIKLKMNE